MRIDSDALEKADPELERALREADEDETVRAIMVLGNGELAHEPITAEQFASRHDYREAMIQKQRDSVERSTGGIRKAVQDLNLITQAGNISRTVLVEGAAKQILRALELPGVQHASLDQRLTPARTPPKSK
jgi:hypothetical protein